MSGGRSRLYLLLLAAGALLSGGCGGGGGGGSDAEPIATATFGGAPPTRTATERPGATRTPTRRSATPTPDRASVCGGSIGSSPRLCNLRTEDAGASGGYRYIRFSYCAADLEGDIDKVCVGVSVGGSTPSIDCSGFAPRGSTINECLRTDPIPVAPVGFIDTWVVGINVGDRQGHISNTITTGFTCCR